jgi:hypothetical protein
VFSRSMNLDGMYSGWSGSGSAIIEEVIMGI